MIDILFYVLVLLACFCAVGLNILSLPGNWVMLVVVLLWTGVHEWHRPGWVILTIMVITLLAGEVVEFAGSMIGARKFGASKTASWAAIGGAMVGALFGFFLQIPIIGNLIGAVAGAFLAAWIVELIKQRPMGLATKAAIGAALGRGVGILTKIGCGALVWLMLAIFGFPS